MKRGGVDRDRPVVVARQLEVDAALRPRRAPHSPAARGCRAPPRAWRARDSRSRCAMIDMAPETSRTPFACMSRLACQRSSGPLPESVTATAGRPRSCSSSATSPPAGSSSFRSAARTFLAGSKRRSAESEPARSCRSTVSCAASASSVSVAEPDAESSASDAEHRRGEHDLRQREGVDDDLERWRGDPAARPSRFRSDVGLRSMVTFAARSTSMSSMRLKSAERVQTTSTPSSCSHAPSRSETVIRATLGCQEKTSSTPSSETLPVGRRERALRGIGRSRLFPSPSCASAAPSASASTSRIDETKIESRGSGELALHRQKDCPNPT